jgi:TPP-dependent trihydroxycyclohexane-1,2-dione (THcHDO) dehydratase
MKYTQIVSAIALTTLGFAFSTTQVQAASIVPQPTMTDVDFNKLMTDGKFVEKYVAQSRIGNNATNGTQEIDLLDSSIGNTPVGQLQKKWTSGQAVDFKLEYKNSVVTYIVDGQTISSNKFSGKVSDIFFRTRSNASSSMLLSDLVFSDSKTSNLSLGSLSSFGNDIDYLQLSKIAGDFTLTGKSTMTWSGTTPGQSALAYQVKVGTTPKTEVPEPAAAGALLLLGAGLAARKRR